MSCLCKSYSDCNFTSSDFLLFTLSRKLLYSKMKKSPLGPMRKYYYLTDAGIKELDEFIDTWNFVKRNVENVLEGKLC